MTDRHPRWTRDELLAAIKERAEACGIKPGDFAPLSGQLGASLCNAAHKLLGGKDKACVLLGYVPNGKGASRAKKMRDRAHTVPAPRLELVADPICNYLAIERELYLARMRERYAAHPEEVPVRIKLPRGRKHIHVRPRWDKSDDFLPPDDLTVPHRRTG